MECFDSMIEEWKHIAMAFQISNLRCHFHFHVDEIVLEMKIIKRKKIKIERVKSKFKN